MYSSFIFIAILIFLNAWFSTIEAALFSINTNKVKFMTEAGDKKASILNEFLKDITKQMSLIQTGITFTGLLISAVISNYFVDKVKKFIVSLNLVQNEQVCYFISFVVITFALTYFILVFGAFIPKRIGIKYSEKIAYQCIGKVKFFGFLLKPFVFFATVTANFIVRLFGINPNELDANITEEEIRMLIDAGGNDGSIDETEKEMINNIFEFDNTSVGDIATHRTDIVAVAKEATMEDIIHIIKEKKYSRIPVYEENIDNIIGIFHIKDVIKYILSDEIQIEENGFYLSNILMTPYYVPFSKKIDELFEQMQKEKIHMAIVIDEYGGTAGIVTMEDLLEEIVGNIFDEYDEEEDEEIITLNNETFLIKGTTDLSDVEDFFNVVFDENKDYDTLGGFLIGQLGRIPEEGEHPEIIIHNILFKVEKIEEKRIELAKVSKNF